MVTAMPGSEVGKPFQPPSRSGSVGTKITFNGEGVESIIDVTFCRPGPSCCSVLI